MKKHTKWFSSVAFLVAVGCTREMLIVTTRQIPEETSRQFKVHGAWSQPVNGLTCCILLRSDTAMESECVEAVFVIRNVGERPVTLYHVGSPPFGDLSFAWKVGEQRTIVHPRDLCAVAHAGKVRLQPGRLMAIGPMNVVIPPTPGRRNVSASFRMRTAALETPPVVLDITAAEWGEPCNGIRLRVAALSASLVIREQNYLRAYIHNLDHTPLRFPHPQSSVSPAVLDKDLISITYRNDGLSGLGSFGKGFVAEYELSLKDLPAEPGDYKLRVIIEVAASRTPQGECWHGRVVSNVIPIRLVWR